MKSFLGLDIEALNKYKLQHGTFLNFPGAKNIEDGSKVLFFYSRYILFYITLYLSFYFTRLWSWSAIF